MPSQIVVYELATGVINQIMSFNKDIDEIPPALELPKRFDITKVGFLVDRSSSYINIKRDRVVSGRIARAEAGEVHVPKREVPRSHQSPHQPPPQPQHTNGQMEESIAPVPVENSLFENVSYKKLPDHIGMMTPWNQECGIAHYSRDLINNLDCKVTVFCNKTDDPEYDKEGVEVIPY